ncbi:MAG TPA: FHA domain-containing protein, partial [Polyangiaceae bacterium]|nr:FHA domain-containing protein [Polyangiaceae bacterium]
MARLILTSPEGQQVVTLAARNSLGRHPDSSIQILDKIVSKEHCRISFEGASWLLEDLDSLNGTFLNGTRLAGSHTLQHGDEFSLGATRARFEHDGPDPIANDGVQRSLEPGRAGPAPLNAARATTAAAASPPGNERRTQPFEAAPATRGMSVLGGVGAGQTLIASTPSQIQVDQQEHEIGTQIAAQEQGFRPFQQISSNPAQMAADYERLRLSHELSREICLERDLKTLLNKILASMFRFVRADRGVIFLVGEKGQLEPGASLRRDGSEAAISVSSTIMDHVMRERASVLTHDAAMDFAGSKGRSMILNRISS